MKTDNSHLDFENAMLKKIDEKKPLESHELRRLASYFRYGDYEQTIHHEEYAITVKTIVKLQDQYFLIKWSIFENDFEEREFVFTPEVPEKVFPVSFWVNSSGKIVFQL